MFKLFVHVDQKHKVAVLSVPFIKPYSAVSDKSAAGNFLFIASGQSVSQLPHATDKRGHLLCGMLVM